MKRSDWNILICVLGSAALVSCGAPGVPIPPSLELAKPVSDLRAARKGDKVYLAWTVPSRTVDRQSVRHPGVTRICRSLKVPVADCKNPVAEVPAARCLLPDRPGQTRQPRKLRPATPMSCRESLQEQDPTGTITYAVSVQNESGRSAGLSNQVQVPSAPTLPPPDHFRAEVKNDGVLLSWDCPRRRQLRRDHATSCASIAASRESRRDTRVSDASFADCSPTQPVSRCPNFLTRPSSGRSTTTTAPPW